MAVWTVKYQVTINEEEVVEADSMEAAMQKIRTKEATAESLAFTAITKEEDE